eukprot:59517-Rhodomonas_salina.1
MTAQERLRWTVNHRQRVVCVSVRVCLCLCDQRQTCRLPVQFVPGSGRKAFDFAALQKTESRRALAAVYGRIAALNGRLAAIFGCNAAVHGCDAAVFGCLSATNGGFAAANG